MSQTFLSSKANSGIQLLTGGKGV